MSSEETARPAQSRDPLRDKKEDHSQVLLLERDQARLDAARLRKQLDELTDSPIWRATKPLRVLFTLLRSIVRYAGVELRKIYWRLPLSTPLKLRSQTIVFAICAPLIRNTKAYRNWSKDQSVGDDSFSASRLTSDRATTTEIGRGKDTRIESSVAVEPCSDFVEHKPYPVVKDNSIRLIAFYLPQFHPIAENDEWWGKGFTEWTNVTRALPQFDGHYQPKLPADLGFYDLRVPAVQLEQINIAKNYGIGGFCYYFYWFDRKRLLELPLRRHLETADMDFPFCLCWANENWTRRWDGMDQQILIAQCHSEEDDIAFIAYISEYLRDQRYIRINGKPLLIVYRPSILPDARETTERWRTWCRTNGVGEIYLACVFGGISPEVFGLDAALEFPPNTNNELRDITHQVPSFAPRFTGTVYDWRTFLERSEVYPQPDYRLFRTVCPSWDNEARRPGRGTIFMNSSPASYQQWLENACADTLAQVANPDEHLVFINAWNEWAEGAYLEPDRKYGFAWLEATREALVRVSQRQEAHKKLSVKASVPEPTIHRVVNQTSAPVGGPPD